MRRLDEWGAERVAHAWNADAGPRYRLDPELIVQNLYDHPLFHGDASWGEEAGFVAIKRSAHRLYAGPDPTTAHLSLLAGKPEEALSRALRVLSDEGVETLVVGMDSGHFLPGAPLDLAALGPWLEGRGFDPGGVAVDLERDLQGFRAAPLDPSVGCRTLGSADLPAFETFLDREFPGRWHYDATLKIACEGPGTIFGLFVGDACEGFAMLQEEGCVRPLGGAVWRSDLGPRWGALGPIGISQGLRGKGLGTAFLQAALEELSLRGARRTIIDWTGLLGFYEAQGFTVTRRYRSYRLTLPEGRPPSASPRP